VSTRQVAQPSTRARPGWPVWSAAGLLGLLGVSAIPSGLVMLVYGTEVFPAEWLDDFPLINSLVLPGLTLLVVFGVGSLVTAYGVLRRPRWPLLHGLEDVTRHHWAWSGLLLIGLGHTVWIGLEFAYLANWSFLQPTYGILALALVALALSAPVRSWLSRR
jgi:hypothetical protein